MDDYPRNDDAFDGLSVPRETDDVELENEHHISKEALVATSALGMIALIGVVAARRLAKKKSEGEA